MAVMVVRKLFRDAVVMTVRCIPRGETLTYSEVARRAGHPKAARAVGSIMRANKDKTLPCHRVVAKNGLGGYNGLQGRKRELLLKVGALISAKM
jgi:O-6-methylguanine DNA methyltransferase